MFLNLISNVKLVLKNFIFLTMNLIENILYSVFVELTAFRKYMLMFVKNDLNDDKNHILITLEVKC